MPKHFELDSRFLSVDELRKLIPEIDNQKRGALYTPSDARAEPELATRAIAGLAQSHGATVLEQCAVRGVEFGSGQSIRCNNGTRSDKNRFGDLRWWRLVRLFLPTSRC